MNLAKSYTAPAYTDGCFLLGDITDQSIGDFKQKVIRLRENGKVYYRELAVFDRTRAYFEQLSKEVTLKVAIPLWWDDISSDCVIVVDGVQHKVYNCAKVISKQGYKETELTCVTPEMQYEVIT